MKNKVLILVVQHCVPDGRWPSSVPSDGRRLKYIGHGARYTSILSLCPTSALLCIILPDSTHRHAWISCSKFKGYLRGGLDYIRYQLSVRPFPHVSHPLLN
jgi:hypothetical protein